ncbi:MAG: pyridoxamine 5'-phosphate oxidase [Pseudomonadota bacterium]
MTDRDGIFAGEDPFALTRDWMAEAAKTEPNDPNAMQLATVDAEGRPNVRTVLLKDIEDDAFVFYTNYESAKGREIAASGMAAFVIHWKSLGRQVRVRGLVTREDGAAADAYYASRALGSRIGAHASEQSRPLENRATLEARVAELEDTLGKNPPRPAHWGGFRIAPFEMEFWADGAFRLHDRFVWRRLAPGEPWSVTRLHP